MKEWLKNLVTDIAHDVGSEFSHKMEHGAHEVSAALFNGSAFVMYPRGSRDEVQQPEQAQPQLDNGREM